MCPQLDFYRPVKASHSSSSVFNFVTDLHNTVYYETVYVIFLFVEAEIS